MGAVDRLHSIGSTEVRLTCFHRRMRIGIYSVREPGGVGVAPNGEARFADGLADGLPAKEASVHPLGEGERGLVEDGPIGANEGGGGLIQRLGLEKAFRPTSHSGQREPTPAALARVEKHERSGQEEVLYCTGDV